MLVVTVEVLVITRVVVKLAVEAMKGTVKLSVEKMFTKLNLDTVVMALSVKSMVVLAVVIEIDKAVVVNTVVSVTEEVSVLVVRRKMVRVVYSVLIMVGLTVT